MRDTLRVAASSVSAACFCFPDMASLELLQQQILDLKQENADLKKQLSQTMHQLKSIMANDTSTEHFAVEPVQKHVIGTKTKGQVENTGIEVLVKQKKKRVNKADNGRNQSIPLLQECEMVGGENESERKKRQPKKQKGRIDATPTDVKELEQCEGGQCEGGDDLGTERSHIGKHKQPKKQKVKSDVTATVLKGLEETETNGDYKSSLLLHEFEKERGELDTVSTHNGKHKQSKKQKVKIDATATDVKELEKAKTINVPRDEASAKKRKHRKGVSLKVDDGDFKLASKETHTENVQERYEDETSAKEEGLLGTLELAQGPKLGEKKQKKRNESGEKRKSTDEDREAEVNRNSTEKGGNSANTLGANKHSLEVTDEKSHVDDVALLGKPEVAAVNAKKQKDTTCEEKATTGALAFKRVHINKVEYADSRLKDNSYWAKDGAEDGYGAKAQEVLGFVRGRDFRHEKTKKKRGSYRGGAIDLQSHSIKFEASDED